MESKIVSPVGAIQTMFLTKKVFAKPGDYDTVKALKEELSKGVFELASSAEDAQAQINRLEANKVHVIRLEFDGEDAEHLAWKEQIEAINPGKIGTKHASKPGNFTVSAATKFDVNVLGLDGEQMEDLPPFGKGSTGKAAITVVPSTKNKLGGTIYLDTVQIVDLDLATTEVNDDAKQLLKEKVAAYKAAKAGQ